MVRKLTQAPLFFMLIFIAVGLNAEVEKKVKVGEIIVGFVKNTSESDIKSFEKKFSLTVVKKFKRIYAIRYQIPMSEDCKKTIAKVQKEKIVNYAEKK